MSYSFAERTNDTPYSSTGRSERTFSAFRDMFGEYLDAPVLHHGDAFDAVDTQTTSTWSYRSNWRCFRRRTQDILDGLIGSARPDLMSSLTRQIACAWDPNEDVSGEDVEIPEIGSFLEMAHWIAQPRPEVLKVPSLTWDTEGRTAIYWVLPNQDRVSVKFLGNDRAKWTALLQSTQGTGEAPIDQLDSILTAHTTQIFQH